jgi:hypothetical protein
VAEALFVDPQSQAMQAYQRLQTADPARAALIYQIASQSQAIWLYGDGSGMTVAEQATASAMSAGAYPVFAPFACLQIPAPDSPAWIRDFAQVISAVDSAVVVEPNVLPQYGAQYAPLISASIDTAKGGGKDARLPRWRPRRVARCRDHVGHPQCRRHTKGRRLCDQCR